jgi:type VI protein secretion system component Hcp
MTIQIKDRSLSQEIDQNTVRGGTNTLSFGAADTLVAADAQAQNPAHVQHNDFVITHKVDASSPGLK